jgi:ribosomal protein L24
MGSVVTQGASTVKVKIRKGDTVEVISGRTIDKGKRGEVIRCCPKNIVSWSRA